MLWTWKRGVSATHPASPSPSRVPWDGAVELGSEGGCRGGIAHPRGVSPGSRLACVTEEPFTSDTLVEVGEFKSESSRAETYYFSRKA